MNAVLAMALICASAGPTVQEPAGVLPMEPSSKRSGLWSLGIGIELPNVGPMGGVGSKGRIGTGYSYGAAISWEATPRWDVRIFGAWSATKNGRAPIKYFQGNIRRTRRPGAEWYAMDWGVGARHIFKDIGEAWSPYLGADFTFGVRGYEYYFGRAIEGLATEGRQLAEGVGIGASVRGGARVNLTDWLSGLIDLTIGYSRVGKHAVASTVAGPNVTSVKENVWTARVTYAIRVGL